MPAGAHSNTTPRAESSSLVEKGGGCAAFFNMLHRNIIRRITTS
jgi:hypothetical protein